MKLGDLFVRVVGDVSQVEKDVANLGQGKGAKGAGMKAGSLFAKGVSTSMSLIGPAGGAAFLQGVDAAAQFQDQLQTIRTVAMDLSDTDLKAIGDAALSLSAKTGKPIEDLTSGLYDLVSAGVPAKDAIDVLAASSNLAIGGLGTTSQAVDAVTSAMNAYGKGTYSATQVTDIFAKAVADGKVTTAEIGDSLATVAPIAAQAGIKLEEVSAGYAQLTAQGVPAAEAATKMRSSIVALISPNETLNRIQAKTGINFAKLAKEKGLSVALQKLREVTGATGTTFSKFAGELNQAKPAEVAGTVEKFRKELGLTKHQADEFITAVGNEGAGQALTDLARKLGSGDAAFADALGRVEAYQFALSSTSATAGGAAVSFKDFDAAVADTTSRIATGKAGPAEYNDIVTEFKDNLGLTSDQVAKFADTLGTQGIGAAVTELKGSMKGGGDSFTAFQGQIEETMGASGLAAQQAAIKMDSPVEAGKRLAAQFKKFQIETAGPFADSLGPAVVALNQTGGAMSALIRPATLVGAGLGKLATKAVPALASGLGKIGTSILPKLAGAILPVLGGLVPALGGAMAAAGSALGGILSAAIPIGMALLPVLLIAAVVAAIIFLINHPEIVASIAQFAGEVIHNIVGFLAGLGGALIGVFGQAFGAVVGAVGGFVGGIVNMILSIPGRIIGLVGSVLGFFENIRAQAIAKAAQLVVGVATFVLSIPARIGGFVAGVLVHFAGLAVKVLGAVASLVGGIVTWFMSIPGKLIALGGEIVTNIIRGLASLPGRLADAIRGAFANLRIDIGPFHISASGVKIDLPDIKLPGFAIGSYDVPADMLAMVHQGEMIVPAGEAEAIRRGRAGIGAHEFGTETGAGSMNVELHTHGLPLRAETPLDVALQLRRVGRGIIAPYRPAAWSRVGGSK